MNNDVEMENAIFQDIVSEVRRFAETAKDFVAVQEFCVGVIAARLSDYNWVGFYRWFGRSS